MKIKFIYRIGDRTDSFMRGEQLMLKWEVLWNIISVRYNEKKNITAIKLQKDESLRS